MGGQKVCDFNLVVERGRRRLSVSAEFRRNGLKRI